jgi:hypothetical protein
MYYLIYILLNLFITLCLCTTEFNYYLIYVLLNLFTTMITRAAMGSLAAELSALGSNNEIRSPENAFFLFKPILTSQCPGIFNKQNSLYLYRGLLRICSLAKMTV